MQADVWSKQVLNRLLDVPYHHLIMAIPWQLRIVIMMNRQAGLNLLVRSATEAIQQWARDIKRLRMGILIVIHALFCSYAQQTVESHLVRLHWRFSSRSTFQYSIHRSLYKKSRHG